MAQLTEFGKEVYKWLIENEKTTSWLCDEVTSVSGLYCDRSYLGKILSGKRKAEKIVGAIEQIIGGSR